MNIIKKQPNPSGAYPPIQTWNGNESPQGYAEITADTTEFYNGFIILHYENDIVTSFECNTELWEAWNTIPRKQVRKNALQRIDGHCSAAIQSGVVVDGKRYSLSVPLGQINLSVAIAQADSGQTDVPFSAVDENKPAHYTAEQIKAIGKAANEWGLVNTTYYSYLKDWIERETDVDILNSIEYGSPLPDDLMLEFTENLAGFGINITKYADMLGGKD